MQLGLSLEGRAELERELLALAEETRGATMSQAVRPAAELVLDAARALAPARADQSLRNSLFAEENVAGPDGAEWIVGCAKAGGWYAPFVEFGTGPHEQHKGAYVHPGATPHPFLRPALEANQAAVEDLIAEQLAALLEAHG
jgi:HK97 gp10 family phage protein